jgi:hypothetical protein
MAISAILSINKPIDVVDAGLRAKWSWLAPTASVAASKASACADSGELLGGWNDASATRTCRRAIITHRYVAHEVGRGCTFHIFQSLRVDVGSRLSLCFVHVGLH